MKWKIWKIHFKGPKWCKKIFAWHYVPDQLSNDISYAGITLFSISILYSDLW